MSELHPIRLDGQIVRTDPGFDIHAQCAPAVELAALKARRCDGCRWWTPMRGRCALPDQIGSRVTGNLSTAADHACSAWTPADA